MLAGPVDEVPDDEEVIDEARFADDAELKIEAFDERLAENGIGVFFRRSVVEAVAAPQAGDTEIFEVARAVGLGGDLDGKGVFGITLAALRKRDGEVAHLGDELGVGDGFGDLDEEFFHLGAGLQVKFLAGELHALLLLDLGAGLDAEHRVVRAGIAGVDVVNVVGGDDLEVELFCELEEPRDDFELLGDAVILDFDEVVFAPENIDEARASFAGFLLTVVQ